ncbi:MAG: VOC family protein [Desulfobacteraceae bacterium]|jgi:hypothetical protein|nr:VOC family protein [Desulfobacteraceae bacterium]
MQTRLDHLVIGAADLPQGIAFVREKLGVDIPFGGTHEKMATHNHLLSLGDDVFLEVIAIDPQTPSPERPRWFGLDDPYVRRQIQEKPALLTWVVNTHDIQKLLQASAFPFGKAELLRRGDLSWYFGLPEDGRLLAGGMLPYVIQWRTTSHPARRMAGRGCRLEALAIHHPHATWLQSVLESIGAADLVNVHPLPANQTPYLLATIETRAARVELQTATKAL